MAEDVKIKFGANATEVEQAAKSTKEAVDEVRKKLQQTNTTLGSLARQWASSFGIPTNLEQANDALDRMDRNLNKTRRSAGLLSGELRSLVAGVGLSVLVKQTQEMADAWTRSQNLLSAVGIASKDMAATQQGLVDIAINTRTALEPTIFLYSRLYRSTNELGYSQEQVARATEIANMAFKAGGAAVSEQNAAILQLSQALGSGILQGDELRSVRENAPLVARAIAQEFDTTVAGLKDLGAAGELQTDRIMDAILNAGEEIEAQYARTDATIADSFTNLQTALTAYIGDVDDAIGITDTLNGFINFLAENISLLVDALIVAATVMAVVFGRQAVIFLIAQLIKLRASIIASNLALGQTALSARLATRGLMTASAAVGVLRGALAALGGPIGLVILLGTALVGLALKAEAAYRASLDFSDAISDNEARLNGLIDTVERVEENKMRRLADASSEVEDPLQRIEQKVIDIRRELETEAEAAWNDTLRETEEILTDLEGQIEDITAKIEENWAVALNEQNTAFGNFMRGLDRLGVYKGKGNLDDLQQMLDQLAVLRSQLAEAQAAKEALEGTTAEDFEDEDTQRRLNEAIMEGYDYRLFLARNDRNAQIAILQEKANMAAEIWGQESSQYQSAITQRERLMEQNAREAERLAREEERRQRELTRNQSEELDTRIAAAQGNREEELRLIDEKVALWLAAEGAASREYQRALQERNNALQRWADEDRQILIDRMETQARINQQAIDRVAALEQQGNDRRLAILDAARQQGLITEQEYINRRALLQMAALQREIEVAQSSYAVARSVLEDKLALGDLEVTERARILNQLEQMEADHQNRIAVLNDQAATITLKTQIDTTAAIQSQYEKMVSPVGNAMNSMFQNVYNGTMTFRDAVVTALDQILFSFVNMGIQMLTQWTAQQLAMTTAQQAGAATRVATATTEASTTTAISGGSALMQIMNYAYTAAAGAFSAMAGIPYIGPILAVAAGAAALAAVLGFASNIFSAEGGWGNVPYDGAVTELHKNEMVLPAQYANPLRSMLSGWTTAQTTPRMVAEGFGIDTGAAVTNSSSTTVKEGDTHLHYAPSSNVNNVSLSQLLRRDAVAMRKWMRNEMRNGNMKKGAGV